MCHDLLPVFYQRDVTDGTWLPMKLPVHVVSKNFGGGDPVCDETCQRSAICEVLLFAYGHPSNFLLTRSHKVFRKGTKIPAMQTRTASLSIHLFASNRSIHVSLPLFFSSLRSVTSALHCIHVVLAQSARWVPLFFPRVAELWEGDLPQLSTTNTGDHLVSRRNQHVHVTCDPSSDHSRADLCFELK